MSRPVCHQRHATRGHGAGRGAGSTRAAAGCSPRQPPASLPQVRVGSQADRLALEEAAAVVASLDEAVTKRVDHIEVETADQILLQLQDGREVTWGSAEQSDDKAEVLLNLLEARPQAQVYDVSVPSLPTTR